MTHEVLAFPFEPGKTVVDGRFLVKGELGQGGMGRCFRVWQSSLERVCVLKMLAPHLHPRFVPQHDARRLLENEAKTLGLLGEGNDSFVQVFDRGKTFVVVQREGQSVELDLPYYTMELLHGHSFQTIIESCERRKAQLPLPTVIGFGAEVARALAIAHERGVIHRDVKPDNIFLHVRTNRPPMVKFIDFGVSTREGDAGVYGTGTTRYGAPELLSRRVERESTQSDVYPLGLVVYEFAALRGPFLVRRKQDWYHAHIYEEPPPLSQFRPDAPLALTNLVAASLSKDPLARPTAKEFASAMDDILAGMGGDGAAHANISEFVTTLGARAARRTGSPRAPSGKSGPTMATTTLSGTLSSNRSSEKSEGFIVAREGTKPFGLAADSEPIPAVEAVLVAPIVVVASGNADQGPVQAVLGRALDARAPPPVIRDAPESVPDDQVGDSDPTDPSGAMEELGAPVGRSMAQVFDGCWVDGALDESNASESVDDVADDWDLERDAAPASPSTPPPAPAIRQQPGESNEPVELAHTAEPVKSHRSRSAPRRAWWAQRDVVHPVIAGLSVVVVGTAGVLWNAHTEPMRALAEAPSMRSALPAAAEAGLALSEADPSVAPIPMTVIVDVAVDAAARTEDAGSTPAPPKSAQRRPKRLDRPSAGF